MKKRIFSILLALCMVLSLVPTTAFAADQVRLDLWIGDVSFKETETNVTKNITGGGTAKLQRGTDSSTLTLYGITVSFDSANMAAIESSISNLTIVLNGTNTINLNNTSTVGIHLMKNTTIKGNSGSQLIINSNASGNSGINVDEGISLTMDNTTMTVNYSATSGSVVGIVAKNDFTVKNTCSFKVNTSMSADGGDTLGYVGYTTGSTLNIGSNANVTFDGWENAIDIDGTMNLSGGTMTIRNSYDGIYHEGTLNLTGGTLNTSGSRIGILTGANGKVKFAGTNATVVGGTAGWGWADESSTYSITGGKVVLQGGSYAASNIYSSIADGYSVYAGSGESSAELISSPRSYTFTGNKYVRIEPKTYYTLTLVNVKGATSASHLAGANISYTAADAPSEQHFAYWTMKVGSAAATKVSTNSTYTGTMPSGNATLTAVYENCSGGTATCQAKAKCSVCGKEYGILALHNFTAEVVDQKYAVTTATCTSGGTYYKSCPVCGASSQNWSNATFSVSALGHSFTEKIEDNAHYVAGTGKDCTSVKKYYYDCANCNQIGTATWNSTTYGPHNYATAWSSDETGHWHVCQNSGCKEVSGFSAHTPDREAATVNDPIKCTECAYIIAPVLVGDDAVLQNLLNNGGTVKLEKDYEIATAMIINSDVTLDLNGYVIKMTGSDSVFKIVDSKTLTLNDSRPTLAHTGDYESLPAGGVITGGNATRGGGVYIESGSFIMNGGTIWDCYASSTAGGVYIYQGCSFTINGGTIDNCKSKVNSSNAIYNQSIIYANGGSIHGSVYLNGIGSIQNTSSTGVTVFYDKIESYGVISGGIYCGGIKGDGDVTGTCYTVSFNLNGGNGSINSELFVNVNTATALKPADPTKDNKIFAGWYNGDKKYNFTEAVTESITLTAKWVSGDVSNETELRDAIDAGVTTIKLVNDVKLSSELNLSDKVITLDLNGHVLTAGKIKLADSSAGNKSILTLIDSSSSGSGVLNGDIILTRGTAGGASHLYANGGTVKGKVSLDSYVANIYCTSNTPTAFESNVGRYGGIYGGIFYGSVSEDNIKEKAVTFMNGDNRYAIEVVASGKTAVAPIEPTKNGYIFLGWYNGDTKYDFTEAVTANITLTAKFSLITYNISYDLGGGIATNPTTYTLESDTITLNNPTKDGYTFTGWSGTDLTGEDNMTVIIPQGSIGDRTYTAHFIDSTAPVISGIENGVAYHSAQTVTVSDNDAIESVTVNGVAVNLDENNQFTLSPSNGTQTIVVTDKAGNTAKMIVTISNAHTEEHPDCISVSGTVTSFNSDTDDVTIQLIDVGSSKVVYETVVYGNTAEYSFACVASGTYTMKVMKNNHATREYTVTVGTDNVTQDAKIHLLGDIDGDGIVKMSDLAKINAHIKETKTLEDYALACADVDGNGQVKMTDLARVNAHIKEISPLW